MIWGSLMKALSQRRCRLEAAIEIKDDRLTIRFSDSLGEVRAPDPGCDLGPSHPGWPSLGLVAVLSLTLEVVPATGFMLNTIRTQQTEFWREQPSTLRLGPRRRLMRRRLAASRQKETCPRYRRTGQL